MNPWLGLLGPTEITRDGKAVRGFESRKALALLCYLAVSGKPFPRAVLADLLWQTKSEAQGRANLSRVLNNLSTLFPGTLTITRETVQIEREAIALDLAEFDALCVKGDAGSLAAAAQLARGEFMESLYLDGCPELEIWLVARREEWRDRVVSVLECLTGYYERRQEPTTAFPFAARLVELIPWHEEAHRHMMRLLAGMGQRTAALQQYETLRRVLAQELGVEPGAETLALYELIRAGTLQPRPARRHNLPAQLTTFLGRETELARLLARLHNPDCRLLTLVGPGGMGKTRLALEAAKHLLDLFKDGVYFVALAPIGVGLVELIVPAIADALGFTFAGSVEPERQLLNYLQDQELLLVLDNFEHLTPAAGLVLDILNHAPRVKVLVTSREPLDIRAEWLTRIEGLSYPTAYPPTLLATAEGAHPLLHYSAVQLFVNRAQQANERFALNAHTAPYVVHLCQMVAGMPLALELATARMQTLGVEVICAYIKANLDFLSTTTHDIAPRHRSLRAVLDWSYSSLSPEEQELFLRLAVFAGGWTLEAAEFVGGVAGTPAEPTFELLGRLVTKSLVALESANSTARYRMLETIRQYALARLAERGIDQKAHADHAAYCLRVADPPDRSDPWFYPSPALMERLESEHDNLRAALAWSQSAEGNAALGLNLAAMLRFWFERGLWSEWRSRLENALAQQNPLPTTRAAARVLFGLGTVLAFQGEYQASQTYLTRSRDLFAEIDLPTWSVYVSYRLGWLARERGDGATARRLMETSLAYFRELGDLDRLAEILITMVEVAVMQEDVAGGAAWLEEGLALIHALGRKDAVLPWALNHAGHIAQLRGDYAAARQPHTESLELFARGGAQHSGIAWAHEGLGETALAEAAARVALNHLTYSLETFSSLGDRMGIAWCLEGLAALAALEENPVRAASLWGAAQTLRESIGARTAPATRALHEHMLIKARSDLDGDEYGSAWQRGALMSLSQVLEYALERRDQKLGASLASA